MTVLAGHQPAFLPWPGYLARIRRADKFALVVGVQYEEKSYTNRNRIKTQDGVKWLTVPVKGHGKRHRAIKDVEVVDDPHWKKKHLKTIQQAYSKAPRFKENWPKIEDLYASFTGKYLVDICMESLYFWIKEYRIRWPVLHINDSPSLQTDGIIEMCKEYGCSTYLSGPLGRDYQDQKKWSEAGLTLEFDDYEAKPYSQLHGEFVPNLSILDMWMNTEEDLI